MSACFARSVQRDYERGGCCGGGGARAPPFAEFSAGMPSLFALSERLSWMPVPGKGMTPIGRTASIASLRLNGAAFGVLGPARFEGDLRHLAVARPFGGDGVRHP
jgi:hypothetical protein